MLSVRLYEQSAVLGRRVSNDAPLTPAQLAEQLASNAKAAAEDGALFVQSYR